MASISSKDDSPVTLEAFGAEVVARRAAAEARLGPLTIARNSGERRTESKRVLLKAIEEAGGRW